MEGGFHTIFVTYISGWPAVTRKDFFPPFSCSVWFVGFMFSTFFWSTRCCNMGKKCLRSYWNLRKSQRSDWHVSFRAKVISRFWFKNVYKVKFTQIYWILPVTLTVGWSALDGIAWPVPLSQFFYYCSDSGHQWWLWPMRLWQQHIYNVLTIGMASGWTIARVT